MYCTHWLLLGVCHGEYPTTQLTWLFAGPRSSWPWCSWSNANKTSLLSKMLVYPGTSRLEATLRQVYCWLNLLHMDIESCYKHYHMCRVAKKQRKKYWKLPAKEAGEVIWKESMLTYGDQLLLTIRRDANRRWTQCQWLAQSAACLK